MSDLSIPIYIEERAGMARLAEAIRIGVPMPRGLVHDPARIRLMDSANRPVPHQMTVLARWPDRTAKWLLLDAMVRVGPHERVVVVVREGDATGADAAAAPPELSVVQHTGTIEVQTGAATFHILESHMGLFSAVTAGGGALLQPPGSRMELIGQDGSTYEPVTDRFSLDEDGPVRATVVREGSFRSARHLAPVRFKSRAVFTAGSAAVRVELQLRNTRPAVHPGGAWDLGDAGSWFFRDLTLTLHPRAPARGLRWYSESTADEYQHDDGPWSLYQDSSGGQNWDSPNHIDRHAQPTVAFRGYQVNGRSGQLAAGDRATPGVTVLAANGWVAASAGDFWQNFPKALRWRDGALGVSLFPGECRSPFELQGGEQKRHTVLLDFGSDSTRPAVPALQHPVAVWVEPSWVEQSEAILWFTAPSPDDHARHAQYVQQIVDGPHAFVAKRELIDEFGWRNFGELYADHEAVRHTGPRPFISHYNNQYDFIYGAFVHFLRSGDARWRRLLDDAARHVVDIDLYHTQGDRAAYNGGLFWHTDHYLPAATCTHRTHSRLNGGAGYGGGPGNEHNYTSGLLHYYYLTGDSEAADAVRGLADWVLGMDDGSRTLFAPIDSGATGGASRTLEALYHRPGRGAGNSINALLDAYTLSRERRYLSKAEELIQRCVHPSDDIAELRLDDPEHRWSYLVFLQVLGKYLEKKLELDETGYGFHYARESLLHYATWIAENEAPYKDVLHKVELPTETWPAHDVRKSHVLYVAARHSTGIERARFEERAGFFFERCLGDLLEFTTANLTRPLVILCVYGTCHDYFRKYGDRQAPGGVHNYSFGSPSAFLPQRERLRSTVGDRLNVVRAELARIVRDMYYRLISRVGRAR